MDFHLSPYNHHQTAFITQPLINMSNPDGLRSIFEDSSDIEMEDLTKPNVSSSWNSPFDHSSLLDMSSAHHGTSYWASAYIKWYHHHSHHSYWPTISFTLMIPETISFGRGHHRSWDGNTPYQDRSKGSQPLLDHLPYGIHRTQVLNLSRLRSCDRL